MAVHDWTRVDASIFHDLHLTWISQLQLALNRGLLPGDHYALTEQHTGNTITEVLTLPPTPGTALARRRSLAIRHVNGHRLVALLEMVSPANQARAEHVKDFAGKAVSALAAGIHLLLVDLFPPGSHDLHGMHGAIRQRLEGSDEPLGDDAPPADEPLTLAAYTAGPRVEVYLEHLAVGADLPDMPLFLRPDRYVNVPLGATYEAAYRGVPAFWRDVLEGQLPQAS